MYCKWKPAVAEGTRAHEHDARSAWTCTATIHHGLVCYKFLWPRVLLSPYSLVFPGFCPLHIAPAFFYNMSKNLIYLKLLLSIPGSPPFFYFPWVFKRRHTMRKRGGYTVTYRAGGYLNPCNLPVENLSFAFVTSKVSRCIPLTKNRPYMQYIAQAILVLCCNTICYTLILFDGVF